MEPLFYPHSAGSFDRLFRLSTLLVFLIMQDDVLKQLRRLNLAAPPPSWTDRWSDFLLDRRNALFGGIVLVSVLGMIYLFAKQ